MRKSKQHLRCMLPPGAILTGALLAGGLAPAASAGAVPSPVVLPGALLSLVTRVGPSDARLLSAAGLIAARVCRRPFMVPPRTSARLDAPTWCGSPLRCLELLCRLFIFVWGQNPCSGGPGEGTAMQSDGEIRLQPASPATVRKQEDGKPAELQVRRCTGRGTAAGWLFALMPILP